MRKPGLSTPALIVATLFPVTPVLATPHLDAPDQFVAFAPKPYSTLTYDRHGGNTAEYHEFPGFGMGPSVVNTSLQLQLFNENPDHKGRVRLTLSGGGNPNGTIEVYGYKYQPIGRYVPPRQTIAADSIEVHRNGTFTTTEYFDEVTRIETQGLGTDVTLGVEFWLGHEQEMNVAVGIADVSRSECLNDYSVFFNGQPGRIDWYQRNGTCFADLEAGIKYDNGVPQVNDAYRAMYFGLDATNAEDDDAFFHFSDDRWNEIPSTRNAWINGLPYGGFFFDVDTSTDTHLRPVVIELERLSDRQIIDTVRTLYSIQRGVTGQPVLVRMDPDARNAGAIAQLSPVGLDRLEFTHQTTLPYPIAPAGTQPRLSERAIALAPHPTQSVDVNLTDLPDEDYWTKRDNSVSPQFAGYRAYQAVLVGARGVYRSYRKALQVCQKLPPWEQAGCQSFVNTSYCVKHEPHERDFRVHVDHVSTFFEPDRPTDALVVGDIVHTNLSFGTDQIFSDFDMENISGWLRGTMAPDDVRVEWDKPALDPCFIEPRASKLSDFDPVNDYEGWLTCDALEFTAAEGSLAAPIPFDVVHHGESTDTPFAPFAPEVTLAGVAGDPGAGTCGEPWLAGAVTDTIEDWDDDVADAIEGELETSPGEDEALKRLLSPYELGIEQVDDPPVGTPPYDVHPLDTYSLSARIDSSGADTFGPFTSARDGMYLPYVTRSSPVSPDAYPEWFCHLEPGQPCDDNDPDTHARMWHGGLDPDGTSFDVALGLTTAHISQALWAQARRDDFLGSPSNPARLDIADDAILGEAQARNFGEVVDALLGAGSTFRLRYYEDGAPYTFITDGLGYDPPRLFYVTPNIVVDLLSVDDLGNEDVVATFLVDVIDRNFDLKFRTGGAPDLAGTWGDVHLLSLTTTFVPGCYDIRGAATSCSRQLEQVVDDLLWPALDSALLRMIERAPAVQLFDSGQESPAPRHLKNVRTFLDNQSVDLFGDICNPSAADCD
jgi:hypothetical protein